MKIVKYNAIGQKSKIRIKDIKVSIVQLLYIPIEIILLGLLKLLPIKKRETKYKASLCLIFKDEAPYLKEWIEYHKLIGVEHFYLYNNRSTDNYMKILEPYIQDGDVTLIDWPYDFSQNAAYENAFNNFRNESMWIGYIDADEFINLQKYNSIHQLLDRFKKYPSVYFHWRMFGSSGHLTPPKDNLILENYTSCWKNLCDIGKTFINTSFNIKQIKSPHYMITYKWKIPFFPVALNGIPCVLFKTIHTKSIENNGYINHYWSKSYKEYYTKDFLKGDAAEKANIEKRKSKFRFEYHELNNKTKDFSIQRWIIFLKQKMNIFK